MTDRREALHDSYDLRHIDWLGREVEPSKRRRRKSYRQLLATLSASDASVLCVAAAILACAFMMGCASLSPNETNPEVQALIDCATSEQCVVFQIRNDAWNQAVVYVNGSRFATVEGKGHVTLPLRRSMLLEGGVCAQVRIRLVAGGGIELPKQCVRRDSGHFSLDIFERLGSSVFTPWGGK